MEKPVEVTTIDKDGNRKKNKWRIKKIVGRRKERKSYVYECAFENQSQDDNQFFSEDWLEKQGWGQKVKVVLAACTWAQPHLIILDEPTNYLDRDSLGALAGAIKEFGGGVLLITHNQEFADVTCKVTWVVANNRLIINGDAEWEKYAAEAEILQAEEAA